MRQTMEAANSIDDCQMIAKTIKYNFCKQKPLYLCLHSMAAYNRAREKTFLAYSSIRKTSPDYHDVAKMNP